jgi:hypothetical protein
MRSALPTASSRKSQSSSWALWKKKSSRPRRREMFFSLPVLGVLHYYDYNAKINTI